MPPRTAPPITENDLSFRERFAALRNLPAFFRQIWQTSPRLTVANLALRLGRAALPTAMLYIGKLIIDGVLEQSRLPQPDIQPLLGLIAAEFGLALLSDVLMRGVMLTDSLLGDWYAHQTSVRLMQHAATLDLSQYEDATFYDKLERARQQTTGRTLLMSQVFSQLQDVLTMALLASGLVAFAPWLLLLLAVAVVPSFIGEMHFNARSYSLTRQRTPQRRELDYYRYIGASDDTAKEVKLFGLSDFIINRYRTLSESYFHENRKLAAQRAVWGSGLLAIGSLGYYGAYGYMVLQTVQGRISVGELTFLAGSFRQLRSLFEGVLGRLNGISQGALYLKDLFDFFEIQPQILSGKRPFPEKIKEGWVFENVSFHYPNTEKRILNNLSFSLKAGCLLYTSPSPRD